MLTTRVRKVRKSNIGTNTFEEVRCKRNEEQPKGRRRKAFTAAREG